MNFSFKLCFKWKVQLQRTTVLIFASSGMLEALLLGEKSMKGRVLPSVIPTELPSGRKVSVSEENVELTKDRLRS